MSHLRDYFDDLEAAGATLSEAHMCARFAHRILGELLGYAADEWEINPHAGEDDTASGVPDIAIKVSHDGQHVRWVVCEAKLDDDLIRSPDRRARLWADKKKYISDEVVYFLWIARRTVLVCDPEGAVVGGVYLERCLPVSQEDRVITTVEDDEVREHLALISAEQARSLSFLQRFREGQLPSCYIEINRETVGHLTDSLRAIVMTLRAYLTRRWHELSDKHREYQEEREELEAHIAAMGDAELPHRAELRRRQLNLQYRPARDLFEVAFPQFCEQQAYTTWSPEDRNLPEEEALADIFRTNAAYVILGRLLFVRFAEDQQDATGQPLLARKISNGGLHLWRQLVGADRPYIGQLVNLAFTQAGSIFQQLFSPTPFDALISLDDQAFDDVLQLVLYRLNAFDFRRLDRDLLGDLYQTLLPRDLRKRIGEFYTDQEVVDYILHRTGFVEAASKGAPTILDPACGSGTFLVRAAYYLVEAAQARGLSAEATLDLVCQCIHGLDINDFAVFITRMNLLFTVFDLMVQTRRDVSFQVHEANSLALPADTAGANHGAATTAPPLSEGERIREGRYDFVVGNPPYVRGERLPADDRAAIQRTYHAVSQRNCDLAVYFVYRSATWLDHGGTFGMILPRGIADAAYASKLRGHLDRADLTVLEITPLDWACHEVFDSDVVPLVLVYRRAERPKRWRVTLVHGVRSKDDLVRLARQRRRASALSRVAWRPFSSATTGQPWALEVTHPDVEVREALAHHAQLGTLAEARYGVKLGARSRASDVPGDRRVPLLTGSDVFAYWSAPPARYADITQAADASLWHGSVQEASHGRFVPRKGASPPPELATVVPEISLTLNAATIPARRVAAQNSCTLCTVTAPGFPDRAVAALLNSSIARWYAFIFLRAGVAGGGRRDWHIYPRTIEALPVPDWHGREWPQALAERTLAVEAVAQRTVALDAEVWAEAVATGDVPRSLAAWPIDWRGWPESAALAKERLEVRREAQSQLQLSRSIALESGDPAALDFLQIHLPLVVEQQGRLTRAEAEALRVPDARAAREVLARYRNAIAAREQAREEYLRLVDEIDEAVFDAFEMPDKLRSTVRRRMSEFPLNENAARYRKPWEQTRRPRIKAFEPGERYS